MSYRPIAAGHAAQETPRTVAQVDISELVERALAWLDGVEDYDGAFAIAEEAGTTPTAAGLLAIHPLLKRHNEYHTLGLFISALWNRCEEKVITYPYDTPELYMIGHKLARHKTLHITGTVGSMAGSEAEGTIVIAGTAGMFAGEKATGTVIVKGTCDVCAGHNATGTLITLTPTSISTDFKGTHVSHNEYAYDTQLSAYVDRLLEIATNDPEAIEETFGDGETIRKSIDDILQREA